MALGDRSRAFIQSVLGKVTDPGQRQAAEALFGNQDVLALLDDGVAGQSEIDRQLQDLRARTETATQQQEALDERAESLQRWHDNLTQWRGQNQEFVELGVAAKRANWQPGTQPQRQPGNGNHGQPQIPEGVVTQEALAQTLGGFEASVLGFAADQNQLMRDHYTHFGEILDVTPLIKHPKIREIGLIGVYNLVHKEALDAKAKEAKDKAEADIRADERRKVMAEQSNMPYPLTSQGPGSGSPLDGLNAKPDPNAGSLVDRAAAEYMRLQQTRPS